MALTTACTASPSKLNVASPVLPARLGGGEAAAPWLMTWPLPRRICARGTPSSSASGCAAAPPAAIAPAVPSSAAGRIGAGVPPRRTSGSATDAHAVSDKTRQAAIAVFRGDRGLIACILGILVRRRRRRLLCLL